MSKFANDIAAMQNEDQKYSERNVKMISAKNSVKRDKHRQDFRKMTTQDFAQMSDDYDGDDE